MNAKQTEILEAMTNPACPCDAITRFSLPEVQLALRTDAGIKIGRVSLKKHLDALVNEGFVVRTTCVRRYHALYTVNVPAALDALTPRETEGQQTPSDVPFDPMAALMGLM
jgi:hypothetical protein